MQLTFEEYRARKIVNVHKHVDGPWFWDKYSAHPYIGCRSGCEFCYARGGRYLGKRDPNTFDTLIQIKVNAVELLRRELSRVERDVIACGDWQQPAEDRYQLSRQMLEVVRDLSFPLFIVERSPLLTRDLDLLVEINRRAWVGVVFSMSNVDPALKHAFEPRSSGVQRRLQTMATLAQAGILVGASLMPIIPFVGDDEKHLDDAIRAVKDHGGIFVMAGGLTMEGVQAELEAKVVYDVEVLSCSVGYTGVARVFDYFMRAEGMDVKQMLAIPSGRKGSRQDFYTRTGRRLGERGLEKARQFWEELHQEFAEEQKVVTEIVPDYEGD